MKSSKPLGESQSLSHASSTPLWKPPSWPTPPTFKTKQAALDLIALQFGLPLSSELTGLPAAAFPKFPTVGQLAVSIEESTSPNRPTGLFEELLQSRPEALYLDASDHPEKYEDGVLDLARDLVQHKRDLSSEERALLDRAIIDFMAAASKTKPKPLPIGMVVRQPAIGFTDEVIGVARVGCREGGLVFSLRERAFADHAATVPRRSRFSSMR